MKKIKNKPYDSILQINDVLRIPCDESNNYWIDCRVIKIKETKEPFIVKVRLMLKNRKHIYEMNIDLSKTKVKFI